MLDTFNDTPSGIKQTKGFESLPSSSSPPSSASPRQKQNLTMAGHPVFTLHYFPFSLYSLMARFGFVLGEELNPATAPRVEIRFVDRHNTENLSEDYLVNVNPKGSVSACVFVVARGRRGGVGGEESVHGNLGIGQCFFSPLALPGPRPFLSPL